MLSICKPLSYSSCNLPLKGLFHTKSSARMYLIQPHGTITVSVLESFKDFATSSVKWASKESHASNRQLKENWPRNSLHQLLTEVAAEHFCWNSSWRTFDSLYATANTMKSLHLVSSALPVRHTETWTFSFPVDFNRTSLASFFNGSV